VETHHADHADHGGLLTGIVLLLTKNFAVCSVWMFKGNEHRESSRVSCLHKIIMLAFKGVDFVDERQSYILLSGR
jgi:hypothetical protein